MILRYVSPSRWWRVLFLIQTKLPSNRAIFERAGFRFRENEQTLLHHNLAALENGQPAQPVEQIKQTSRRTTASRQKPPVASTFLENPDYPIGINHRLAIERRGGRVAEDFLCLHVLPTDPDDPGTRDC